VASLIPSTLFLLILMA